MGCFKLKQMAILSRGAGHGLTRTCADFAPASGVDNASVGWGTTDGQARGQFNLTRWTDAFARVLMPCLMSGQS